MLWGYKVLQIKDFNTYLRTLEKISQSVVFLPPMALLLYNLFVFLASNILRFVALFHPKVRTFVTGRKGIFKDIASAMEGNTQPVAWFHCASLGEFEQGRPIMESVRNEFPQVRIFLTFFSPSGYEIRKNYPGADHVFYLPWDTRSNARKFIATVKPALAVFIKYEFWFHYSNELKRQGIPLYSVSSKFRRDQVFFSRMGNLPRRILSNFSHFFVQNSESVKLLNSIDLFNSTQAGDTRFDRVMTILSKGEPDKIAQEFKDNQKVFVVGSAWNDDLEVLIPFINENRLKFIVAPHEIDEDEISELERALQVKSVRYSQANGKPLGEYDVLIVDNIGKLSKLYRYGEFAFIGGAYGKGLHNILEAACYGIPILFGNKNYEKFQEAVDLINRGGAFAVNDYPDLKEKYEMLNTPETFLLACEVTRQYVEENLGATEKIMKYCRRVLDKNKP